MFFARALADAVWPHLTSFDVAVAGRRPNKEEFVTAGLLTAKTQALKRPSNNGQRGNAPKSLSEVSRTLDVQKFSGRVLHIRRRGAIAIAI